jgi:hydrogenase/urease accessory protein HupE
VIALLAAAAWAHEIRPGYLEITETGPTSYEILWKKPAVGDGVLAIDPRFPEGCTFRQSLADLRDGAAFVRGSLDCPDGLTGVRVAGLETTITDVFVRVRRAGGAEETWLVQPAEPSFVLGRPPGFGARVWSWTASGIEHILRGADHLLFVLGLLLLVPSRRVLLATVTAFTAAHSVTLALATLDVVHLPTRPVEAAIALSILFLGPEIARRWRGETSFTLRRPWVVAFVFGLLHGFGFATALSGAGIPRNEIPIALACFNVGVELGQLLFVGAVLAAGWAATRVTWPSWVRRVPGYVVGSMGAFWFFDRVAALLTG